MWISIKSTRTTWYMHDSNVYKEYSCTQILLKPFLSLKVWETQGGIFTEKYCIDIYTSKAGHVLTLVALSGANKSSRLQIYWQ